MIYKSKVEFEDYSCNHVLGCSHGCKYPCYAQMIALRFGRIKTAKEWISPIIKENALNEVKKDIKRLKGNIKEIHLCFMTDVFMYHQPEVIKLSLQIIKELKKNNIRFKTLTKGETPYEDIIEIEKIKPDLELFEDQISNSYGISLVSLNEDFRKKWEPNACEYEKRINSLEKISEAGLDTYVYMEPFSPEDVDFNDFTTLLSRIKFVNKIIFGSWQYNKIKSDKSKYSEYVKYFKEFCDIQKIEYKIKKEIALNIK